MPKPSLTPEVLSLVAERFRALGEPARLQLLRALQRGPRTVGELVDETGLGQANTSKHLQLLHSLGFIARRKDGLFVHYELADQSVFELCDIVCGRLDEQLKEQQRRLAS
ncbi:MAG: metalloregulator ArsR/SmtB family transcription factor [Gemmatimonadaceae bacterium]|jgi:DNA-binding transcriptional ArsR family regulator|nr:metalloregulator ArsR/SmtB family transcription factor [Gemmatimonadaceae bacterium]